MTVKNNYELLGQIRIEFVSCVLSLSLSLSLFMMTFLLYEILTTDNEAHL